MIRRISLRALLLVPLVLQMALTAGLISLFSYQGKQQAAAQLAARSQERASDQVRDYLSDYLKTPQQVIRLMADAVADGRLDPADRPAVTRYLWQLQRNFPDAPYVNYGWANGDFIGLDVLHAQGRVAWVTGLSMPSPNLSHFTAGDLWAQGGPRARILPRLTGRVGWADSAIKPSMQPMLFRALRQ